MPGKALRRRLASRPINITSVRRPRSLVVAVVMVIMTAIFIPAAVGLVINHAATPISQYFGSPSKSAQNVDTIEGDAHAAAPEVQTAPEEQTPLEAKLDNQWLMNQAIAVNEETAAQRARLNSPTPNRLNPLSYVGVNRALESYQNFFTSLSSNPWLLLGVALPITLLYVGLTVGSSMQHRQSIQQGRRPAIVHPLAVMAILAVVLMFAMAPLRWMSVSHSLTVAAVGVASFGDEFEKTQIRTQRELIDVPAAESVLGPSGRTDAGVAYITALREGVPVTPEQIETFRNDRAPAQTAATVPVMSLAQAELSGIFQRPLILVAELSRGVMNILLHPFVLAFVVIRMLHRNYSRRYFLWLVRIALTLVVSTGLAMGFAKADLFLASTARGLDVGFLAAILASAVLYLLFHGTRVTAWRWLSKRGMSRLNPAYRAGSITTPAEPSPMRVVEPRRLRSLMGRAR